MPGLPLNNLDKWYPDVLVWGGARPDAPPGAARFFRSIWLTEQRFGLLHLALAYVQTPDGYKPWAIVGDEPVSFETFEEYG